VRLFCFQARMAQKTETRRTIPEGDEMATHIKDVLAEFLKEKRQDLPKQERIRELVTTIVGKSLAQTGRPAKIDKDTLVIFSDDPASRYLMELKKADILKAVSLEFPEIKKVTTRIAGY
jgi:hypothetical protein